MKHKHSEIIKAFVDGVECEYYYYLGKIDAVWLPIINLRDFDLYYDVRIKPEPKPDVELFTKVYDQENYLAYTTHAIKNKKDFHNLKLIFDGETGELKDAEVIKNG